MLKCAVLVVAAGKGHRFGTQMPKQYQTIAGKMVLRSSLATFCAHPSIQCVRAVINMDDKALYETAAEGLNVLPPVSGGKTRQESVLFGLESLKEENPDIVLIHDGARPFVDFSLINRVILKVKKNQGALPAVAVVDTIKKSVEKDGETLISHTVERENLWRVQTPQGFMFEEILEAHLGVKGQELTDDASLFEKEGKAVVIVKGEETNFKITTQEDLQRAIAMVEARKQEIRCGSGFDVHKFSEGAFVTLCGVEIPHNKGLEGHSDADVALHALTDALLGAVGAGDIGLHFPPSEPQWKGCDSSVFLKHAVGLVLGLGAEILNVDITMICERPKIGAYRLEMVEKLSEMLEISASRISIKATTTEQLGFTGRKEGIAAQASVSLRI